MYFADVSFKIAFEMCAECTLVYIAPKLRSFSTFIPFMLTQTTPPDITFAAFITTKHFLWNNSNNQKTFQKEENSINYKNYIYDWKKRTISRKYIIDTKIDLLRSWF